MRILIKNGHVISPRSGLDSKMDIRIDGDTITAMQPGLQPEDGELVIEAEGMIVAPGLVDIHCHLREPGYEYKEDIRTGTRSAARGGFTSIACMPNTNPIADNVTVIDYIKSRAREVGVVHVFPIGSITRGLRGDEMAPIGELKFSGAIAVSDDGRPVMNANMMKNAMIYADMFDIPVISHCEDLNLAADGVMHEGFMATKLGLRGITPAAEEAMVARDIVLADTTHTRVHIAHVSTRGSVALVRDAKRRGVHVTCETCPHYFSLTEEACANYNTLAKMNPPLRTQDDVDAIIEGLRDGTIDAIATDHAPHHEDEKEREFDLAPNGIIGFETALPLAVSMLYKTGKMSLAEIIACMTCKPSDILQLNKGDLHVGAVADIMLFDPERSFVVHRDQIVSKAKNTPFLEGELYGEALYTIVAGELVLENGVMKK